MDSEKRKKNFYYLILGIVCIITSAFLINDVINGRISSNTNIRLWSASIVMPIAGLIMVFMAITDTKDC